ncbi:MAG: hypothetical protein DMG40_09940 [Acidobacteria bacterium]|nr:MAG: hypothetical protein DMG40_09940 [Acidobacteriota bacterium]
MRRIIFGLALLLLTALLVADNAVSTTSNLQCSLTGKKTAACCCEQKNGSLYCPLAKKKIEQCCCK